MISDLSVESPRLSRRCRAHLPTSESLDFLRGLAPVQSASGLPSSHLFHICFLLHHHLHIYIYILAADLLFPCYSQVSFRFLLWVCLFLSLTVWQVSIYTDRPVQRLTHTHLRILALETKVFVSQAADTSACVSWCFCSVLVEALSTFFSAGWNVVPWRVSAHISHASVYALPFPGFGGSWVPVPLVSFGHLWLRNRRNVRASDQAQQDVRLFVSEHLSLARLSQRKRAGLRLAWLLLRYHIEGWAARPVGWHRVFV